MRPAVQNEEYDDVGDRAVISSLGAHAWYASYVYAE